MLKQLLTLANLKEHGLVLSKNDAQELHSIINHISQRGGDAEIVFPGEEDVVIHHIITQDDLDRYPELVEQGVKVGDEVGLEDLSVDDDKDPLFDEVLALNEKIKKLEAENQSLLEKLSAVNEGTSSTETKGDEGRPEPKKPGRKAANKKADEPATNPGTETNGETGTESQADEQSSDQAETKGDEIRIKA